MRRRWRFPWRFASSWCVLLGTIGSTGCNSGYTLVEVKGQVTRGNEPVSRMSIQFRPLGVGGKVAGPGSYALLDDEGRYELRTVDHDWPGAVPGKHAVTLVEIAATSVADGQLPDVDPRIPPAFRNGSVTIEIPDTGLKNADFDLRKK